MKEPCSRDTGVNTMNESVAVRYVKSRLASVVLTAVLTVAILYFLRDVLQPPQYPENAVLVGRPPGRWRGKGRPDDVPERPHKVHIEVEGFRHEDRDGARVDVLAAEVEDVDDQTTTSIPSTTPYNTDLADDDEKKAGRGGGRDGDYVGGKWGDDRDDEKVYDDDDVDVDRFDEDDGDAYDDDKDDEAYENDGGAYDDDDDDDGAGAYDDDDGSGAADDSDDDDADGGDDNYARGRDDVDTFDDDAPDDDDGDDGAYVNGDDDTLGDRGEDDTLGGGGVYGGGADSDEQNEDENVTSEDVIGDTILAELTRYTFSKMQPLHFLETFNNPCFLVKERAPYFPAAQTAVYGNNPYANVPSIGPLLTSQGRRAAHLTGGACQQILGGCRLRCTPSFLLVGLGQSETAEVYNLIAKHPEVTLPAVPAPRFWDEYRFLGMNFDNYLDLYDNATVEIYNRTFRASDAATRMHTVITGELNSLKVMLDTFWSHDLRNNDQLEPYYQTVDDLHTALPLLKVIFLVRSPVDHLYWLYWNNPYLTFSSKSVVDFHQRVNKSMEWWKNCTSQLPLRRCYYGSPPELPRFDNRADGWWPMSDGFLPGFRDVMYHVYVTDWLRRIDSSHMLILDADDYYRDPLKTLSTRVYPFLDLAQFQPSMTYYRKNVENVFPSMQVETRTLLNEMFAPFIQEFKDLVKDNLEVSWDDGQPREYPADLRCCGT